MYFSFFTRMRAAYFTRPALSPPLPYHPVTQNFPQHLFFTRFVPWDVYILLSFHHRRFQTSPRSSQVCPDISCKRAELSDSLFKMRSSHNDLGSKRSDQIHLQSNKRDMQRQLQTVWKFLEKTSFRCYKVAKLSGHFDNTLNKTHQPISFWLGFIGTIPSTSQ
jgi:hypothetical protein